MNLNNDFKRVDNLLNNVNDIIWSVEYPGFKRKFINPAAERVMGVTLEELYKSGRTWKSWVYDEDKAYFEKELQKLLREGKNQMEYRITRADGDIRVLNETAWIIYGENGKPIRIEGVSKDITEHRQVEDQFFKGKELYYTVMKSLPGFAVIVFSPALKITYAEGELLNENSLNPEELVGKTVRKVIKSFSSEPIPGLKNIFKEFSFKYETLHHSNFYDLSFSPLKSQNGRIESGILIIQDVTESKLYANSVVRSILHTHDIQNDQLAFNMHEEIGQMIFGIKLQLERLEKNSLYESDNRTEIQQLKNHICSAINQIKKLSSDLSPAHVEDFGLESTLPDLCYQIEQSFNVNINLRQVQSTKRYSREFELSLYKFFKEMLYILIDKQHATDVNIYINEKNGYFNLKIINNGTGFDKKLSEDNFKLEARINAFNGNFRFIPGIEHSNNKIVIQIPVTQVSTY